jgi:hypothetical protein
MHKTLEKKYFGTKSGRQPLIVIRKSSFDYIQYKALLISFRFRNSTIAAESSQALSI